MGSSPSTTANEIDSLRARLAEAEDLIHALRHGEIDALLVQGSQGDQIYTLKGAEHPYRVLIETMNEGAATFIADDKYDIYYGNRQLAALLRLPLEKVIGTSLLRFVSEPDRPFFELLVARAMGGGSRGELVLLAQDGTRIPALLAMQSLELEGAAGICLVITDLSEQKRQDALIAQERLARAILEQVAEPLLVCDPEGIIMRASRRAERLAGSVLPGQFFGDALPLCLEGDIPLRWRKTVADPMNSLTLTELCHQGSKLAREASFTRSDGQRFSLLLSSAPLYDDDHSLLGCIITLTDITERKQVEERLQRHAEELASSNAELDAFAYIASHDLKEPLRGIHNYAQFLQMDEAERLTEQGQQQLATIQRLTKRMDELIASLAEYSRVGRTELKLETIHLKQVLDQIEEMLKPRLAECGATLRLATEFPIIKGDRVRVTEVFENLISNAIKYNDKTERWIDVGYQAGTPPVFYVRDNGIGIKPQHHEKIFQIFRRLHGRDAYGGGNGAGLTIVKKIIERHGGKIWLESTPGEGSTFYFTLALPSSLSH